MGGAVAPAGPEWPEARLQMLDRYLFLLAQAASPLLDAGDAVVAQVKAQFLSVVDEASGSQADAGGLSDAIGRDRASSGVHPSESLAAANLIFAAALPGLADHLGGTTGLSREDTALCLNAAILRRMAAAATAYVDYLLDKAAVAHRDEATRLSRELHDEVGPAVAVGLQGVELAGVYLSADPERVGEKLGAARESLLEAMSLIRSLSAETRVAIAAGELPLALSRHLETLPAETNTRLTIEGDIDRLPAHYAYESFLILREAIRNAMKHGQAGEVTVDLTVSPAVFVGVVSDDGTGFVPDAVSRTGTGLAAMKERAALLGAELAVGSTPGRTTVTLAVPLPHGGRS